MPSIFEDRLHRLVCSSWPNRRNNVLHQIGKMKAEHAARGIYQSSMTAQRLNEILDRELESRSILIWQAIVRVHKIVGIDTTVDRATYFKELFQKYHNEALTELTPIFEKETRSIGISIPCSLPERSRLSIKKHDIEIDLYVDSVSTKIKPANGTQAATYNFYGNVGAVQSGAGAQANVVQNLGETEIRDILSALEEVKLSIQSGLNSDEKLANELVELVEDSVDELRKENPNNSRLRACFGILSGTIQSLASAGPAYQALKNALLPLGISLP